VKFTNFSSPKVKKTLYLIPFYLYTFINWSLGKLDTAFYFTLFYVMEILYTELKSNT
jgi:hypothetical protein